MNAPIRGTTPPANVGAPYGNFEATDGSGLDFDIRAVLRTLRKRLGLILGVTFGITALVLIAVFQLTPLYTAQTLVLLDRQQMQIVDMAEVMSGVPGDSAAVDSEVEILRSKALARRVVDDQKLIDDPEFNSALQQPSPLRYIDPRFWIRKLTSAPPAPTASAPAEPAPVATATPTSETPSTEAGATAATAPATAASTPQTPASAAPVSDFDIETENREARKDAVASALLDALVISRVGGTYIIEINLRSESPEKAARLANAIADAYVLDQLEAKFDATKQASEWLSRRLTDLRKQVADAERAVEIYRTQHGLEKAEGLTVGEQQLSELNAQLILANAALVEARAKYDRAWQIRTKGGNIESVADVLQSTTISGLRQKQAELAREQANLSAKYGPRHPAIVNIEAQQADIQRQIGAEVERIIESIRNNVSVAETRVRALEGSLKQIKGETGVDNQALIQLRELEREAASNRTVYEAFLNRHKETTEQQGLQTADTRIISRAAVPRSPSHPRTFFIGILALVLSLMTGVGLALLLEHLDNTLLTGKDLEQALDLPLLVSLPVAPAERGVDGKILLPQDYLLAKPLSTFSESLRSLRSALQLSNVDNPPKIILFTSALPGEGKTTTATSFARAAAASGLKVILIDCDLRHPSVHKALGLMQPAKGLVQLLAERLELETVVINDARSGLDIVPVSTGTANPPDLLGSAQMKLLLQRLSEIYDLVVLDSAPVLPVADSRVLSRLADETVFVVRWNATPRDAAMTAIKHLRQYDAKIAGAVLSVVDTAKQARYGYGDGGYYYSRYSKYYVN